MILCTDSTYNIYLDDERIPIASYNYTHDKVYLAQDWNIIKNYDDFCYFIQKNYDKNRYLPELISFDHDLAPEHYNNELAKIPYNKFEEKTGYDCAFWLIEFCFNNKIKFPQYLIHSNNPIGKRNINNLISKFLKFQEIDLA